jgi:hypothetical protein
MRTCDKIIDRGWQCGRHYDQPITQGSYRAWYLAAVGSSDLGCAARVRAQWMTNRVTIKSCRSRIRPTLGSQIPVSKNPDQQLVKQCTGTWEKSLIETSGSSAELQVWKATQTQETMRTSWCLPATSVSARTPGIAFQRQCCPKIQEQITVAESNPNPQTTALNQLVSPSCLCEDATRHRNPMPHVHSTKRS